MKGYTKEQIEDAFKRSKINVDNVVLTKKDLEVVIKALRHSYGIKINCESFIINKVKVEQILRDCDDMKLIIDKLDK